MTGWGEDASESFDLSHMSELFDEGQAHYSMIYFPDGGMFRDAFDHPLRYTRRGSDRAYPTVLTSNICTS